MVIGEHLNFYVARSFEELLHVDGFIAESGSRFSLRDRNRVRQRCLGMDDTHTAAAAATGGLDDDRVADLTAEPEIFLGIVSERAIGTDLGGKYVMVVGGENLVEQRYIELGPREDDGYVVVTNGLEGDESYIVNGLLRARPGFPVTPEPHREDGDDKPAGSQG